jgi:predicted cupin superfamily sugar epimerase
MSWKPGDQPILVERASFLIRTLGLIPHVEGGYYTELYRASAVVQPEDQRGARPALTTIYFLLPTGCVSRWHRVLSDEVWHYYEGAPLDLWTAPPDLGRISRNALGPLAGSRRPACTVPAGWWQAARSTGEFTLVGCTVGPGFDFRDFMLASTELAVAAALEALDQESSQLL